MSKYIHLIIPFANAYYNKKDFVENLTTLCYIQHVLDQPLTYQLSLNDLLSLNTSKPLPSNTVTISCGDTVVEDIPLSLFTYSTIDDINTLIEKLAPIFNKAHHRETAHHHFIWAPITIFHQTPSNDDICEIVKDIEFVLTQATKLVPTLTWSITWNRDSNEHYADIHTYINGRLNKTTITSYTEPRNIIDFYDTLSYDINNNIVNTDSQREIDDKLREVIEANAPWDVVLKYYDALKEIEQLKRDNNNI